jgi:hypothetical protein
MEWTYEQELLLDEEVEEQERHTEDMALLVERELSGEIVDVEGTTYRIQLQGRILPLVR